MTLNQILKRVETIALAHKQVKRFYKGQVQDFLTNKTNLYPAVLLQDNGGSIDLARHQARFDYKLFFVDLVHVAADSKDNEQDVHSDMISVAMDILAQLNHPGYNDWIISGDNNLQLVVEQDGDMYAGAVVDISVSVIYRQNVCAIPTNITGYGEDSDVEVTVPSSGAIVLRAYNTGNRVRVRIYENVGTEEPQWEIEKI